MSITKELKKLELMASYATTLVNNKGREKIKSAGMYQPLLKSAYLSVWFGGKSLAWYSCTRLDKEVSGVLIYITLVEKTEMNESIVKLKRKIRAMIKSPESFSTIDF